VGHFRLGRPRNDEDIPAPIALMGHTIPMHTDGVGRAIMHFGILLGKAFDAQRTPLDLTLELQLRSLSALVMTFGRRRPVNSASIRKTWSPY
jgi:hypothetical protein